MAGRSVNVGAGSISISPVLAPGFGGLLQAQLNRVRPQPTINVGVNVNQQGLRGLNSQINSTTGAATRLRTVFTGAFAALQARALQQNVSALSGVSNKITEIAGAATSAGSALGPLLGLVGGLGVAFGVAGAGVGAFAALAKPQITAVTTATQAVSKAQDAYNTAIATGNAPAAQKALQDRAAALATLTPQQRLATQATLNLKDAFKQQSDALAPVTLGLYTNGVKTLTGLLPALAPIAKAAGSALQGIFGQAQAGLGKALAPGGGLGSFLNVVTTQIGPVLRSLSTIVVNLGSTLSHVFSAAVPIIQPALDVLKQLTGELSNASSGSGLLNFFKQVAPLLQPLRAALTSIGAALGSFIQAALPLAGPVLNAVNVLASALFNLFNGDFFKRFVANVASIVSQIAPLFQQLVGPLGRVIDVISGQFAAILPQLIPVVVQFANVFANVLVGLSPLLPLFAQLIGILVQFLPVLYPIIQAFRAALAPVLQAVGQALLAILPSVNAIIQAFTPLLPLFGRLLAAIVPIVAQLINAFAPVLVTLLNAIKPLIPIITQIVKLIAGYFAQAITIILKAITPLLPALSQLAGQILTALLAVFKAIEPVLLQVIRQFVTLLPALLPIVQVAGRLLIALLPLIPPLIRLASLIIPLLVGALKLLAPIITALGDVLVWLVKIVVSAATWILNTIVGFVHGFTGFFQTLGHDIAAIWNGMWDGIKFVLVGAWNAISGFFTNTIAPAFSQLWQSLVDVAKKIWNGIVDIFKTPINLVIGVVNKFDSIVDDVTNAVGLGRPLPSNIPGLAAGGGLTAPGYSKADVIPAMYRRGEHIWTPEEVRGFGGHTAVGRARSAALGGRPVSMGPGAGHVVAFAGGGSLVGTKDAQGRTIIGEGTLSGGSFGAGVTGVLGTAGSALSAPFDAAKWVLDEAQHLLRVGAADAANAAYQGLIKPVLSAIGNSLGAQVAVGAVNRAEKDVVSWIRGKESAGLSGAFIPPAGPITPGSPQAIAKQLLPLFGWGPEQFDPLNVLWTGESSWNPYATNPSSGAYGIPQSLPADKMAAAGPDWRTNPATQERWGMGYIKAVYGSPANALSTWLSRSPHWYGAGGVARGWSVVGDRGAELINAGASSRVLSNTDSIQALVRPAAALALEALTSGSSGGSRRPGLFEGANVTIGDRVDLDAYASHHDWEQRRGLAR